MIRGLRSLTSMHYTAQPENHLVRMIDRLTLGHDARSPQLCAKPLPVEHVLGTIAFRLRFGGVLRGRFVPRTWFDRVPAETVLAGTRLFRTRSDYKKWCVPRTCSENMFPLEMYREQVWTPGSRTKTGAASCWESRLMNPNWMRGQSFPNAVRAPPFHGGNLNQNLYQYYCRTDIPFICCRCSLGNGSRLWRWLLVSRSFLLGHRALFLAWTNRFLINQLDKGSFFSCCHSPLGSTFGLCSVIADQP